MVLTTLPVKAARIPDPALILYGSVTNTDGRLLPTAGGVNWLVVGGASSASASSTIPSVTGQYFYLACIPIETRSAGNLNFTPLPTPFHSALPLRISPGPPL
jgi:hypothetical protein